jgi:hypothetical protein
MFHGQWFTHGSKTILQETAHSKSLYLINKCEDNPTASIFKKCKIRMMAPEDEEIIDDGQPDANDFHCGYVLFLAIFMGALLYIKAWFGTMKMLISPIFQAQQRSICF